jgi:hypothetical protein
LGPGLWVCKRADGDAAGGQPTGLRRCQPHASAHASLQGLRMVSPTHLTQLPSESSRSPPFLKQPSPGNQLALRTVALTSPVWNSFLLLKSPSRWVSKSSPALGNSVPNCRELWGQAGCKIAKEGVCVQGRERERERSTCSSTCRA